MLIIVIGNWLLVILNFGCLFLHVRGFTFFSSTVSRAKSLMTFSLSLSTLNKCCPNWLYLSQAIFKQNICSSRQFLFAYAVSLLPYPLLSVSLTEHMSVAHVSGYRVENKLLDNHWREALVTTGHL